MIAGRAQSATKGTFPGEGALRFSAGRISAHFGLRARRVPQRGSCSRLEVTCEPVLAEAAFHPQNVDITLAMVTQGLTFHNTRNHPLDLSARRLVDARRGRRIWLQGEHHFKVDGEATMGISSHHR